MSVNYVIACWMGPRRADDPRSRADRSFFLREHLRSLSELEHSIDRVTIVVSTGGDEAADAYATSITNVGGVPVTVILRPNIGFSYASWNHSYDTFKGEFSHYILVEDDYAPCLDGFDEILVGLADRHETYVCGLAAWDGVHAAISNGVVSHEVWEKVHPAPYVQSSSIVAGNQSQISWSKHFSDRGFPVKDWIDTHSSPFWRYSEPRRHLRWYGAPGNPPMFIPVQAFGDPFDVVAEDLRAEISIDRRGCVTPAGHPGRWGEFLERPPAAPCWRGRFTVADGPGKFPSLET